ncbi:hypothetical protein MGN70_009291 [Eutypa lata]|nr:hypothetical protein MGN70_009291 [Eutypa lata]
MSWACATTRLPGRWKRCSSEDQEALQITEVTQIWLVLLNLQNRKEYWDETSGISGSAVAAKGTDAALTVWQPVQCLGVVCLKHFRTILESSNLSEKKNTDPHAALCAS